MIRVEARGMYLYVHAGPRDAEMMRMIPGARYDKASGAWRVFAGLSQVYALGGVFGKELEHNPQVDELLAGITHFAASQRNPARAERPRLFDFQNTGVSFLRNGQRVLLADEMGTGKTVQTLVALKEAAARTTLVICTKSMMHKWAAEVRTWWPEAVPIVIEGTPKQRIAAISAVMLEQDAGVPVVAIINYESMKLHTKLAGFGSTRVQGEDARAKELNLISWDAVVADEAHKIKDPRAKQTRAAWAVSEKAPLRFALTGTPVVNNPDDLWSIMHFVCPEEWPTRSQFRERYCILYTTPHGGYENVGLRSEMEPELRKFLDPRMLRRTKAEVLPQLPDKLYDVRPLPMDTSQSRVYKELATRMMAELDEGLLVVTDPLVLAGRLRMAACAVPTVDGINVVGLSMPSNKVTALLELVEELAGKPLVVFAESRKLIELTRAQLPTDLRVGMVTGQVAGEQRAQSIAAFQSGELDLMLCTTGAGAEGITLTAADTLVFLQQSWSNVANKQAEDRIHRIGQASKVRIITLISEGTIEEAVYSTLAAKDERLQEVVRDPYWMKEAIWGALGNLRKSNTAR